MTAPLWRAHVAWWRLRSLPWLDVKLAGRMMVKHPGLTIVAGLAIAIGIPAGLAPLQLLHALTAPLPFDEPDRIVGLKYQFIRGRPEYDSGLHDFERWQAGLTSLERIAAARRRTDNVIGEQGLVEMRQGAEMTASAFVITRVTPVLGRALLASDEARDSPPVVVIGYDLWQSQFGGVSDVVGRTLQFGRTRRTVVGVMPAGFLFPYRDHFWVPLQVRAIDYPVGKEPKVKVFGRLRDGVTMERARAELSAIGYQFAAEHPETHADLRPDVIPATQVISGLQAPTTLTGASPLYVISLLLLGVASGNVGTLMLARGAARTNEIAIRTALGARRSRIVTQLFVEALVLAMGAAAAGLALMAFAASRPEVQQMERRMPFWFDLGVDRFTVTVAAGLAVFSAVIAGLLPALKVTGKHAYTALQRHGASGSGLRFGAAASILIVLEVALAVGGLSGAGSVARGAFRSPSIGDGIAAHQYLTAELELRVEDRPGAGDGVPRAEWAARYGRLQQEIARQLGDQPHVRAVTFASHLPGMDHRRARVEIESADSTAAPAGHVVRRAFVGPNFFSALGQSMQSGRDFEARDATGPVRPVVVNRSFVAQVLRTASPIGQRIRYQAAPDAKPQPWHEIIGVVNDLGMNIVDPMKAAGVYEVVAPGELYPAHLVVRVNGEAAAFVSPLRTMLTAIEPELLLDNPVRLDGVFSEHLLQARLSGLGFTAVAVIGIALSAAALYALMAFSVSQRTREIAIRIALGARPMRIVRAVIGRAAIQLACGVALGAGLGLLVVPEVLNEYTQAADWRLMLAVVAIGMAATGALACTVPTRRALRIQPVEALKDVG